MLGVPRLTTSVQEPLTLKWSLCLSHERFHRSASPDSRGGDRPSGLFRTLQMTSRTAKVEDQRQFRPRASHPAALHTTREMTEIPGSRLQSKVLIKLVWITAWVSGCVSVSWVTQTYPTFKDLP